MQGFNSWVRKIPWSQKWQPTPVSLPAKFHRQRNLVGCSLRGHKGLDTTKQLSLEKEMATCSSILAWRILWTEELGGKLSMGSHSQTRLKWLSMHAYIGEGYGNPLQYSCLENPRDRATWWAAVYGVAQSQTRLKQLSSSSSSKQLSTHTWPKILITCYICITF